MKREVTLYGNIYAFAHYDLMLPKIFATLLAKRSVSISSFIYVGLGEADRFPNRGDVFMADTGHTKTYCTYCYLRRDGMRCVSLICAI